MGIPHWLWQLFVSVAQAQESYNPGNPGFDLPKIIMTSSVGLDISQCNAGPAQLFLACYIRVLYVFFLQAAVVLAVFMIIIGGYQWLMAAGNSSRVGTAKSTITGAITGLVLALISYFLFAQINSSLVNFNALGVTKVQLNEMAGAAIPASAGGVCPDSIGDNQIQLDGDTLRGYIEKGNIKTEQLDYANPSLTDAIYKLAEVMKDKARVYRPRISSIIDDKIINGTCYVQEDRTLTPDCDHGISPISMHYGGPETCAFNQDRPPFSCAVDMVVPQDSYPNLKADMYKAGFDFVQCELEGDSTNVPCETPNINHIHGQVNACKGAEGV